MKIRAIICDIYQTLLAVGPPPADAGARWAELCRETLACPPRLSLEQFSAETVAAIGREHTSARGFGVPFPEVLWPDIVCEVLPELKNLSAERRSEFLWKQVQLLRTVHLLPSAAEGLRALAARDVALGIASNAQPYTLQEIDTAFGSAGLSRKIFVPALCFFSFEHGFSKPDPHVFRLLTARLRLGGISALETLMIGNRLDNDIGPAKAQGWQTWHYTEHPSPQADQEGDWSQFLKRLNSVS